MTIHGGPSPRIGFGNLSQGNEIIDEFGIYNLGDLRNRQWWTDGGSTGYFSGSNISMYEFYNKRHDQPFISIDYLIVGGGASGSTGVYPVISYDASYGAYGQIDDYRTILNGTGANGFGGGAGRIIVGSTNISPTTAYGLSVGAGGGGGGGSFNFYYGSDGNSSTFLGQTAAGGLASNGLVNGGQGIGATYSSLAIPDMVLFGGGYSGSYWRFMESCPVWDPSNPWVYDRTKSVYFPVTGNYDLTSAVDNYGSLFIDGNYICDFPGFNTEVGLVQTFYMTAGWHDVRTYAVNTGYQAGLAMTITAQGQYFDTTGDARLYGRDGRDGYTGGSGINGDYGTGNGGNGSNGASYDGGPYGGPSGSGGSGCVAIRYPGSTVRFSGGSINISNGYVHHSFMDPGNYALYPV
jgi:hypothetical protein